MGLAEIIRNIFPIKNQSEPKKPLYVLVHEKFVSKDEVKKEIERIKLEEDYISVKDVPSRIPRNISKKREILLCGQFTELCVGVQYWYLKNKGYNVKKYPPGCQNIFNF